MRLAVSVVAVLVVCSYCFADEARDETIRKILMAARDDHIRGMEADLDRMKEIARKGAKNFGMTGNKSPEESFRLFKRKLVAKTKELKEFKKGKGDDVVPQITQLQVGAIGALPYAIEVIQVVDGSSILAEYHKRQWFMLKGIDTAKISDGDEFRLSNTCEVTGTTSYTTVLGATKTVHVVEPLDLQPYLDSIRRGSKTTQRERDNNESLAEYRLKSAKRMLERTPTFARRRLKRLVKDYPDTKAAVEARELLESQR